jgi:hypothetical protein
MRVQAGKYIRKFQENAIVSGVIIEEPHIGINQENEVTGISWMHIREYNYKECEVIIRSERIARYCKENRGKLEIGKRVKVRGTFSEGKKVDYMLLDSYGEITICEEDELNRWYGR